MKEQPSFTFPTSRVEALADGVFAIVMTLIVFEIRMPEGLSRSDMPLLASLVSLWPKFLCFAISFVVLGVYWVGHHLQFVSIKVCDRGLLWINILFMMSVSLIPFSTGLAGDNLNESIAVAVYGGNLTLMGLLLYLQWIYATKDRRLVDGNLPPAMIHAVRRVNLMGPCFYAAGAAISFFNTAISITIYAVVNLLYILPGGIHLHLWKHHKGAAE